MANSEDSSMSTLTVETLLGRRLNDVEQKFAPKILYVKGSIPTPLPKPRLSIVGSRKASANGLSDARLISKTLSEKKVVIVSGLAEGIDTSAHMAAMEGDSKTIAVLWNSIEQNISNEEF